MTDGEYIQHELSWTPIKEVIHNKHIKLICNETNALTCTHAMWSVSDMLIAYLYAQMRWNKPEALQRHPCHPQMCKLVRE